MKIGAVRSARTAPSLFLPQHPTGYLLWGAVYIVFSLYSSFRILFSAFFSSRDTWAWEMPTSADTSIWVLP